MYNLQYSGIITSKNSKTEGKLSLDGLLISTETNPYYQYFDPYFVNHTYAITPSDARWEMRFLFIREYFYVLPPNIPFLKKFYVSNKSKFKAIL